MNKFENHENYNCCITLDNGEQYHVYADWLRNNELHHWQGWHCEAGVSRIMIDKHLQIWGGACQNDRLGDIDQQWRLLDHHTICRRTTCAGCTDDIMTAKWKP